MDSIGNEKFNVLFSIFKKKSLHLCFPFYVQIQEIPDSTARLEECFVRMQIDKIAEDHNDKDCSELKKHIYNPNEIDSPELNLMNLFKPLADIIIDNSKKVDPYATPDSLKKGEIIRNKFPDIFHKIEPINAAKFKELLEINSQRYDCSLDGRKIDGQQFHEIENIINALCHPRTVKSACKLYLEQIQIENS